MYKIDTENNFLLWALEVNRSSKMCGLQDIYAHSMPDVLNRLFFDMSKNDKHLIVFAIQKCMGSESLLSLLQSFISQKVSAEVIQHIDAYNKEISNDRAQIAIEEKAIEEKKQYIEHIEEENRLLKKNLASYQESNTSLYNRKIALQDEIDSLKKELTKQYSFESHIKELLKAA